MLQSAIPLSQPTTLYQRETSLSHTDDLLNSDRVGLLDGLRRRWRRERRRRTVGRAYDMALEIARYVPVNSRVLDVGCGNGFIAHHLSSLLRADVVGIDLAPTTDSTVEYRQFDGTHFPVEDEAVDAVLLCYVLHHAQDLSALLSELRRVLSAGGVATVYEDIPSTWWDRVVCWIHNLKWSGRTGPCTFRNPSEWRRLFNGEGFEVVREQPLSRWRNLAHPVSRRLYVLRKETASTVKQTVSLLPDAYHSLDIIEREAN